MRGNPVAIAALQGPECPASLAYLLPWAFALAGRSGCDMSGNLLPLSHTELGAWSALTGVELQPDEVEALMTLDAAIRHREPTAAEQSTTPKAQQAWPEAKHGR